MKKDNDDIVLWWLNHRIFMVCKYGMLRDPVYGFCSEWPYLVISM